MTATSFYGLNEAGVIQQSRVTNCTWDGATVIEHIGRVTDLYSRIPVFSRHPLRAGAQENRYKDEIRKEPLTITDDPIPIVTVSKTYSLVQHRDVLTSVFRALRMIQIDISDLESTLLLSEYGERMQWTCSIPNFDFDPGDGCPIVLQINCLNSVDTSTALEITFNWYRLVCGNGMMFGLKNSWLRRRHIRSLDPGDVADYLREQLEEMPKEQSLYKEWLAQPVQQRNLETWVDQVVAEAWGPFAAARAWSILTSGFDGDVEQAKNRKPHELTVKRTHEVPGTCAPVGNLFHASQVLSWLATARRTIPERLEHIRAIPTLMKPLAAWK
jgi:hypothetical protein